MNSNLAVRLNDVSSERLEQAKRHILFQHDPQTSDGYITLAKKVNGRFVQYHYKPENLAEHLTEWLGYDVYFSQNTFYKAQRRIENIRQLKSLYVDIDCHTLGFNPGWVLGKLELEQFRQTIPEPNLVLFSGRGLVLVWLIEPVTYHALPLWNSVQNYLLNNLKDLGGDSKAIDAARVFRVAGTINSKSGTNVHVEYRHDYRYGLREIQHDYLPELKPVEHKPNEKKKAGRKKKVVHLFNIYSLNHARLMDITKIVELRNYDVYGYRETICFLYRYWACCLCNDTEDACRQTKEFNDTFIDPLPEKELVRATKSAEKAYQAKSNKEANERARAMGFPGAGYNISNAKLIRWLDITEDEMKHLSTIIDPKEKRRRDYEKKLKKRREEGVVEREKYLADSKSKTESNLQIIREIKEQFPDLSIRKTAEKSGFSKSYVQKLLKML